MEELSQIVVQIRQRWPKSRIVVRDIWGFCREPIMSWCEDHGIGYEPDDMRFQIL